MRPDPMPKAPILTSVIAFAAWPMTSDTQGYVRIVVGTPRPLRKTRHDTLQLFEWHSAPSVAHDIAQLLDLWSRDAPHGDGAQPLLALRPEITSSLIPPVFAYTCGLSQADDPQPVSLCIEAPPQTRLAAVIMRLTREQATTMAARLRVAADIASTAHETPHTTTVFAGISPVEA